MTNQTTRNNTKKSRNQQTTKQIRPTPQVTDVAEDETNVDELTKDIVDAGISNMDESEVADMSDAVVEVMDSVVEKAAVDYSSLYVRLQQAFLDRVKLMNETMGPAMVLDKKLMMGHQLEFNRTLTNFITSVEPKDSRKAITTILDTFHEAPVLGRSCLMKGARDPATHTTQLPQWHFPLVTLLSVAADPDTRFKIANISVDINRLIGVVPPVVSTRLGEYFDK